MTRVDPKQLDALFEAPEVVHHGPRMRGWQQAVGAFDDKSMTKVRGKA